MMKMDTVTLDFCWLIPEKMRDISLPGYETAGAAGMDVEAGLEQSIEMSPGAIVLVPTGWAVSIPPGYELQVRPRSGLAVKHGITLVNSPGTIDSDYRGEVKIILANFGKQAFEIKRGDRIAQLVIARYEHIRWELVDSLDETDRGAGGFGSTGINESLRNG
jgi:dUTP pyrophosphatase